MSAFRTLLWWLLLAALGALAYELLARDLGEVVLRWHGFTLTTTVAFALLAWGLLWFVCWLLWSLLRLPFTAWQRLAQTQARKRLVNGLVALHEGRHARAAALLGKAAEDEEIATIARLAAREAALRQGDAVAAAQWQAALAEREPLLAAINGAESLLAQGAPKAALELLQSWPERQLPPRGLRLRGAALLASGRAAEALPLLPLLARESEDGAELQASRERDWQAAALQQSAHAGELQQRWQAVPAALRGQAAVLRAYAARADQLGLEAEAARALEEAIEGRWDESLLPSYAALSGATAPARLARAQSWLNSHADSGALALALGQLALRANELGKAEEMLTRALAQGAGAEAWEELGNLFTAREDAARAQLCYANALRLARDAPALPLSGRSLREQIAAEAIAEQRDELGYPRL
jgi:HemY protein